MKLKNILVVSFTAAALATAGCGSSTPAETTEATTEALAETTAEETSSEETTVAETETTDARETLQKEIKETYKLTSPSPYRNDTTGKWMLCVTAEPVATTEYAEKYAQAYMEEGDVHWIINMLYKTTTAIRVQSGIVYAHTTEWVKGEEHDAKMAGSGIDMGETAYDYETGEEITVEVDEEATPVASDDLVSKVKEILPDYIGEGDEIKDVAFDGSNLKITMKVAVPDGFPEDAIASTAVSSVTDGILELDDSFYNAWETITVDMGDLGHITLGKGSVTTSGYGKYFDFTDDMIEK